MSQVDKMQVSIQGITPLLLHNGQTANPLNVYAKRMKAVTSKKKKTEEDLEDLLNIQWESGLYWDDNLGLHMPSENLFAAFLKAARKHKLGGECSEVSFCDPIGYPIITENHKNLDKLKADPTNKFIKTVVIKKSKTVACRPIFKSWKLDFDLEFERSAWDANVIKTVLVTWAQRIGLGVWTPGSPKPGTYGKFIIEKINWINGKTGESKEIKGF